MGQVSDQLALPQANGSNGAGEKLTCPELELGPSVEVPVGKIKPSPENEKLYGSINYVADHGLKDLEKILARQEFSLNERCKVPG